jgi:hypothetical protein
MTITEIGSHTCFSLGCFLFLIPKLSTIEANVVRIKCPKE